MQTLKKSITVDKELLKSSYYEALKDPNFKDLTSLLPLDDASLAKHTSLLLDSSKEYHNCSNCKSLQNCKNLIPGYVYMPEVIDNDLSFSYLPCKYKRKELKNNKYSKNIELYSVSENLRNAKMKDIYTDDEKRVKVFKYLDSYIESYFTSPLKGLYLYGNFGSGKTYLIAALFNELAKKEVRSAIVYFPEFLRNLKSSFTPNPDDVSFESKFDYIKKIPLLLLDDLGAENVTSWGRDEILGTLLQYRMDNNLKTFFTSNLSLSELEEHLSTIGNKIEKVKARRIISRIEYLSEEMKLVGVNRRK